jgi:4-amino-4-deoxy-L-arabinose transferase-like glycosyltransferase
VGILAVQAVLSLRLIRTNTAFIDEATYLYAGSQELQHWIHNTPVQDYQTFFSGSPAIYPPIGAMADAIGGLTAARLLGLAFVMGATVLLYATAKNLFDRRTAYLAAALFTALGVTQFLSAFATFDPMALFLLALSGYLVIGRRHDWDSLDTTVTVTLIAPAILALDNATKYATALWDPILIGLAVCAPAIAGRTWRYALGVGARFTVVLGAILALGLVVGKRKYWQGIVQTTVTRSSAHNPGMGQPASLVFHDAWRWIGMLLILVALGVAAIIAARMRGPLLAVGILLAAAAVAAPLNQARIGTTTSLQKHVVFGAWFGCVLAGYGLRRVLTWRLPVVAGIFGLLAAGTLYYTAQATTFYRGWSRENPAFITALARLTPPGTGRYLIEGHSDIPAYYTGRANSLQWKEANLDSYSYVDPQTGAYLLDVPAYADAIKHRAFALIVLNFTISAGNDYAIEQDIRKYGGYHLLTHLPPSDAGSHAIYTVWQVNS